MKHDILRILDANLNRCREALRVIEDHARFVLDDAAAAGAVKTLRHSLREFAEMLGPADLLAARDIATDVGRDTKTPGELRRSSNEDVLRAAFARAAEAARVLSEYAKPLSAAAAAIAEQVRYATYELEQQIALRGALRARFRAVRLYVIVTEALCRRDWLDTAAAAIRGGAGCIQLREKELTDAELLRRARRLREITAERGALLIINDRPDIAKLARADGVHVGQHDLSVGEARRIAGGGLLVGKSTHTLAQFEAAVAEEPDYIAVGPMFDSATKPQPHVPGAALLTAASQQSDTPLVAIGGITAETAPALFEAGAASVCVCSAVIAADDAEAAARALLPTC